MARDANANAAAARRRPTADPFEKADVEATLRGAPLFAAVELHDTLGSTQERAIELARAGAEEGALVVAATQTEGRGRKGHAWASPAGGLWFSLVLRPPSEALRGVPITIPAALAVAAALKWTAGLDCRLKWPNDVLSGRKKLAGVLADVVSSTGTSTSTTTRAALVLGVGIDVNVEPAAFSDDVRAAATSCLEATGGLVTPRRDVLRAFLEELASRYAPWSAGETADIRAEAEHRSAILGRRVRVTPPEGAPFIARTLGLGPLGELIVQRTDAPGGRESLMSGSIDVLWTTT